MTSGGKEKFAHFLEILYHKDMTTRVQEFVELKLKNAQYRYDKELKQWAGWIKGFPGAYGQGKTRAEVKLELADAVEDLVLLSLYDRKKIKGFPFKVSARYA
jgi:predicted RNase H-like HicB family nuclease